MAHRKQLLHELLKEDQEPFRLKSYIRDRRSMLRNPPLPTSALQLRKSRPIVAEGSARCVSLCKHACFLSFQSSPDVWRSPFRDFPASPARSPCKSPVFLHIPAGAAAQLVEAAIRIQKQQKPKSGATGKSAGLGLFGSFLKRFKDRSKHKKRAIVASDFNASVKNVLAGETVSNCRISSAEWTEDDEAKSMDLDASTSSYASEWSDEKFGLPETRFCLSPFRFSFHRSPSSNGRRTPDFGSPAASPSRHVSKENLDKDLAGEEEKEQSSPVSVLDSPFPEEDEDGCESGDADYDVECSYTNVQRAKEQLLYRLQRFEKLAGLDPMELERKLLLEGSDEDHSEEDNCNCNCLEEWEAEAEAEADLPLSRDFDTFVEEVLERSGSSLHPFCSKDVPSDMKKLVCDLIAYENNGIHCKQQVDIKSICNRLDSWKDVEMDTIDMMVGLDLKRECNGWTRFDEQVEETTAEMELTLCGLLVDELSEELLCDYTADPW